MGLFKKKTEPEPEKEPQYYRSVIGESALNYRVYYMSALEKLGYFLLAFVVGAAVGLLFYGGLGKDEYDDPTMTTYILNVIIGGLCGFLSGRLFVPIRTDQLRKGRQKKLKSQFRDMLDSLITALGAGKNVRDAFITVQEDLRNQYEEDAFILKELFIINSGVANGFNLEDLVSDFAARSGLEDIQDFSEVFAICYRRGGNIREMMRNTCQIITDKMAVSEEIETTVSGSKNEQYIMLVMPIVLVGMIKMSSQDFAKNFATAAGVISTTIGIVLFVASYLLGRKLLEIKV